MFPVTLTLHLPSAIVSQMSGTCQHLLHLLNDLCKIQSKRSPSRAWYCFPGEKWLGQRVRRSREQISRSVNKLSDLDLIHITHRRKRDGTFQTNLYRLGKLMTYYLNAAKSAKNRLSYRVTEMSHIVSNTILVKNGKGLKPLLNNRVRGPTWLEIAERLDKKMFPE